MSTLVNCPSCERKLKVPDELLGKKVKCPGCATIFTAEEIEETAPPEEEAPRRPRRPAREEEDFEEERPRRPGRKAPPPEDEYEDEDDRPRSRRRRDEEDEEEDEAPRRERARTDWGKVAKGLTFILMAIVIQIVGGIILWGIAVAVIGGGAGFAAAQQGNQAGAAPVVVGGAGFKVVTLLGLVLLLTCLGLIIWGLFNCMSAPTKNNARQLARVALILTCVYLAISLITQVIGLINPAVAVGANPFAALAAVSVSGILSIIGSFVWLADFIVFTLFLRATALNIRKHGLAETAKYLLIFGLTIVGLFVVALGVGLLAVGAGAMAAGAGGNAPAGGAMAGGVIVTGLCVCVDALMALGCLIWYIINLVQLRAAVVEYADRRGY